MHDERKRQLLAAGEQLKRSFDGIDDVIDEIIKKIEIWWCHPEFLTRPTIVNLYGMTGCGKTDLIRQLASVLNMTNLFCNIEIDNSKIDPYTSISSPFSDFSILGRLYNNRITPTTPAILMIDEIQRHRTVQKSTTMEGMREISRDRYDDMWKLLSDGRLTDDQSRISFLQKTVNSLSNHIQESEKMQKQMAAMPVFIPPGTPPDVELMIRQQVSRPPRFLFDYERFMNTVGIDDDDFNFMLTHKAIMEPGDDVNKDLISVMAAENQSLRLMKTLSDPVMLLLLQMKLDQLKNQNGESDPDRFVYSKLLIFISGNLDNVYNPEGKADTMTPEELYDKTSQITVADIKKELLTMFRPEQVSRFGNNYVIYRSLQRKNFENIIRMEVVRTEKKIEEKFGIKATIDKDLVIQKVFEIGVFPAQGVRPVFSTVASVLGEIIPEIMIAARESGKKSIRYPAVVKKEEASKAPPKVENI